MSVQFFCVASLYIFQKSEVFNLFCFWEKEMTGGTSCEFKSTCFSVSAEPLVCYLTSVSLATWALPCYSNQLAPTHSVVSDSLQPRELVHGNSPGQNTGVCSLSFLQGFFPTQGMNSGLPLCRQILHQLSHQGSPMLVEAASKKSKRSAREAITKTEAKHNPPWCFLWPLGRKVPCLLKSSSTSWL